MNLIELPILRQTYNYDCGAKALQSVLAYYGKEVREDKIMKLAKTNSKQGTPIAGIKKVLKKNKINFLAKKLTLEELKHALREKKPVIILIQAWTNQKCICWEKDWADGHYVVAIGYDKKNIYFEDPSSFERTYISQEEFLKRWHDEDTNHKKYYQYGIIIHGEKPKFSFKKLIHMG